MIKKQAFCHTAMWFIIQWMHKIDFFSSNAHIPMQIWFKQICYQDIILQLDAVLKNELTLPVLQMEDHWFYKVPQGIESVRGRGDLSTEMQQ